MFLNARIESKTTNKVVSVKDGVAIIQHAHFNDRYKSRIDPIFKATNNRMIMHHNLLTHAIKVVEENLDDIITKDGRFKQTFINYQLPLKLKGKNVVVEMTVLITSSLAKFDRNYAPVVNDEFKDYYEQGIIEYRKPVVCIETVLTTLRAEDETRIAYSEYSDEHIIENNILKTFKRVDDITFKRMTKAVRRSSCMCTKAVRDLCK